MSGGEPDTEPLVGERLLERMSDRYVSLDGEWRIRELNDGGREALAAVLEGDPACEELLGRDLWSLVDAEADSTLYTELHRAAGDRTETTFEADLGRAGGWFELRAFPADGGLSVFFRSVAREEERKRTIQRQTGVINELYDVFHDSTAGFDGKVASLLAVGRRVLDTEYATLSRVEGDEYTFEYVDSENGALEAGARVDLSWTSCEVVVASKERLVLSDMVSEAPDLAERKGNQELGLACYIGTPVEVDGETYGTLCFYDREPKAEPFSEWEAGLTDFMGLLVGYELQRRRAEQRLRARNRRLEEFRSVLSHDLRNPVTVAKGYVEVVREDGDLGALDRIDEALDRMDTIINDVSDIATIDDGAPDSEPLEVAAVAGDAWGMVPTDDVTLRVTAEGAVEADESRLQRLFENLFSNAITHNETPVAVEVGDLEDGFYVADDGAGIDAEHRERVFESGHTTDDGTGLGLAIVAEIAESHGWSYALTESETGGVRFELRGVDRP